LATRGKHPSRGDELTAVDYSAASQGHEASLPVLYAQGNYALTMYVGGSIEATRKRFDGALSTRGGSFPVIGINPGDVDRARVEANNDGYRVILSSGARYQLARSKVDGSNKRRAAITLVRSQLASEYSSYMQIWSRFWFLLAGACGVAILSGRIAPGR